MSVEQHRAILGIAIGKPGAIDVHFGRRATGDADCCGRPVEILEYACGMSNGLGLAVWMAHRNSAHAHAKPGRQNGLKTINSGSARCYKAKHRL